MRPGRFVFTCILRHRQKFVMGCGPDLICLCEKCPYLSLWPPRLLPPNGSLSVTSVSSLSISKRTQKIHQIFNLLSSSEFGVTGVKWRMSKREYSRGGSTRKTCFLFHGSTVDLPFHIPHKRFHHGTTLNFPFSSPTSPLLTNTFGNLLTSSSTSLKKRAQLWQHPQAPMIAPSYPHFCQMTELSNTPANQLITATIGN